MDMTPEEIAGFKFRVGRMRFEELGDAMCYLYSNLYAECVEHLRADGTWHVICRDGDVVMNRPGFGVHIPYKSARPAN